MLLPIQYQTIKQDILNTPALNAYPLNADGAFAIAAIYNTVASPPYYIWKLSVTITEIMGNGFAWDRVDNMTDNKARIWDFMTRLGVIYPSQQNVRDGIIAAFTAAGDLNMRIGIFSHCYKPATQIEKLFATGPGVVSNDQGVGPGTTTFTASLHYQDIEIARGLP